MRALILFFVRSYITFLFLFLEGIAVYLLVLNNSYQNTRVLNSTNSAIASMYESKNDIDAYFNLRKTNDILALENAILRQQLRQNYYEIGAKRGSVKDTAHFQQYSFVAAKVINNSVNRRNNYLTLNKGYLHGIQKGMGVITSNGVVGIVKNVSKHYSSVISLLNKEARVSARLARIGYFGSLIWEGGDPGVATLKDVPKHVIINVGDTVETTSFSSIYPSGVKIGTVTEFDVKPGENFYTISVALSTNFYNLEYVYVVNNLLKKEEDAVEQVSGEEKGNE